MPTGQGMSKRRKPEWDGEVALNLDRKKCGSQPKREALKGNPVEPSIDAVQGNGRRPSFLAGTFNMPISPPVSNIALNEPSNGIVYKEISNELNELKQLLADVQNKANHHLEEEESALNVIDRNRKPEVKFVMEKKVTSSWAKSTVPRSNLVGNSINSDAPSSNIIDTTKAEKFVKQRAASISIGTKHVTPDSKIRSQGADNIYDCNIDATSKYSRSNKGAVKFSASSCKTMKESRFIEEVNASEREEIVPVVTKNVPKVFSFGKASRVSEKVDLDLIPSSVLDIDKSKKYLEPNINTALIKKPTVTMDEITLMDSVDVPEVNPVEAKIDILAHKERAPVAVIRPDTSKSKQYMEYELMKHIASTSIGPGKYEVGNAYKASSFAVSKSSKPSVGKLYHNRTAPKHNILFHKAWLANQNSLKRKQYYDVPGDDSINIKNVFADVSPGPGDYNIARSDHYTRHQSPVTIIRDSEAKPSKHIERKKYWEEKARDLRLEFDNLNDINDSLVRPRVSTATINDHSVRDSVGTWKTKSIVKKRQEDEKRLASLYYDVQFDAIEKQTKVLVNMPAEERMRQSIQNDIYSKPGVVQVLIEKKEAEKARDKFYGPQLPLTWIGRPPSESGKNEIENDDDIKEAMSIITKDDHSPIDKYTSDTSEAFLRSTYAGYMTKNIIDMSKMIDTRTKSPEVDEFDYIGPQLPVDWVSESQKKSGKILDMDYNISRDVVKVYSKGVKDVTSFGSSVIEKKDDLVYDVYNDNISNSKVPGVPFSSLISREMQAGPDGEKPSQAQLDLAFLLDDNYFYPNPILDLDYGEAKDKVKNKTTSKGIVLYRDERYKDETPSIHVDDDVDLPVTNDWFKGMAEEVSTRAAVVDIGKMIGRDQGTVDNKITGDSILLDELLEREHGAIRKDKNFPVLDLEIKDIKSKQQPVTIADPITYPRFGKEKIEPELQPLSPKYEIITPKVVIPVDMGKQQGRVSNLDADNLAMDEFKRELNGDVDVYLAIQLENERVANINKAKEITGGLSKVPEPPNFAKQRGRIDSVVVDEKSPIIVDIKPPPPVKGVKFNVTSRGRADVFEQDIINDDPLLRELLGERKIVVEPKSDVSSTSKPIKLGIEWAKSDKEPFDASENIAKAKEKQKLQQIQEKNVLLQKVKREKELKLVAEESEKAEKLKLKADRLAAKQARLNELGLVTAESPPVPSGAPATKNIETNAPVIDKIETDVENIIHDGTLESRKSVCTEELTSDTTSVKLVTAVANECSDSNIVSLIENLNI